MVTDFKKLKEQCNVKYFIKDKELKIGDLTDSQLEIGLKILQTKRRPNVEELNRLKAMQYVVKYRSDKAIAKINNDIMGRRMERATKSANLIGDWITNRMK